MNALNPAAGIPDAAIEIAAAEQADDRPTAAQVRKYLLDALQSGRAIVRETQPLLANRETGDDPGDYPSGMGSGPRASTECLVSVDGEIEVLVVLPGKWLGDEPGSIETRDGCSGGLGDWLTEDLSVDSPWGHLRGFLADALDVPERSIGLNAGGEHWRDVQGFPGLLVASVRIWPDLLAAPAGAACGIDPDDTQEQDDWQSVHNPE